MKRRQIAYLQLVLCFLANAYYLCDEIKVTWALLIAGAGMTLMIIHYHDIKNIIFKIMMIAGCEMFVAGFCHYYDWLYYFIIIMNSFVVVSFMDVYHYQNEWHKYQMENLIYSIMIICFVLIIISLIMSIFAGYHNLSMMIIMELFFTMMLGFVWEKCERCDKIHQWEVIK